MKNKLTWKDTTSYSQGDKVREPQTFEVRVGDLRIIVTRRRHDPGIWYGLVYAGGGTLSEQVLGSKDLEHAKAELLSDVYSWLTRQTAHVAKAVLDSDGGSDGGRA
jgi:hypothetical protein